MISTKIQHATVRAIGSPIISQEKSWIKTNSPIPRRKMVLDHDSREPAAIGPSAPRLT